MSDVTPSATPDEEYDNTPPPSDPDKPAPDDWGREIEDGFDPGYGGNPGRFGDWSEKTVEILDPGVLYDKDGNEVRAPWP